MKRRAALWPSLKSVGFAFLFAWSVIIGFAPALASPPISDVTRMNYGPSQTAEEASMQTSATTQVLDVTQDTDGNIWGIVCFTRGKYDFIWTAAKWDGSHWNIREVAPGFKGHARKIAAAPDGAVLMVCSTGEVVEFRPGSSRLLAKLPTDAEVEGHDYVRLYVDKSDVWAITNTDTIYRIDRKATSGEAFQEVYKVNPDNLFPGYQTDGYNGKRPVYAPLQVTKDSLGRLWFWSDRSGAALRGFLLWDGTQLRYLPEIKGIPNKAETGGDPAYSYVAPYDAGHLWVSVINAGMFSMDVHTLTAMPVPEPEKYAFNWVQRMVSAGADWAVITGVPFNVKTPTNPLGLSGNLWLLHEGKWKKTIAGLDTRPDFAPISERPIIAAQSGLWIGAFGSGLWLVPGWNRPASVRLALRLHSHEYRLSLYGPGSA